MANATVIGIGSRAYVHKRGFTMMSLGICFEEFPPEGFFVLEI